MYKRQALDSVVFTDSVSPTTIPQYFVDAEMLVLARPNNIQAKYGFPTKLGEYLLSGRPVVLTDVGNITDYLKDGVSAFIAKPGDINCISDKMMEVSANPEKNDSVAIAGKEVAMKAVSYTHLDVYKRQSYLFMIKKTILFIIS